MENETVHPGLTFLRSLIPNTAERRAWVAAACEHHTHGRVMPEVPGATPGQQNQIELFIESI